MGTNLLAGFSAATLLLIVRTAFRIVVIAEGFQSSVAQAEVLFLVFDGAMVFLASAVLLAFFPGRVFGRSWRLTSARHRPSYSSSSLPLPPPSSSFSAAVAKSPRRPPRPLPAVQLLPSQKSPGIGGRIISPKSSPRQSQKGEHSPRYSPRKAYPPPPSQRTLVDSETLW
ncbi:hypothetical protein SLS62_010908 [Diatrype stigma]|uniref:Uncharacterized protein n=1 Tax=Diatrype stigma TaxID=117547 RepID=A0AAN9U7D3_9PEZI